LALPYFNDLPSLKGLDPQFKITLPLEVLLATTHSESDIRDVFMFVETECELTIQKAEAPNLVLDEQVQMQVSEGA